MANFMNILPSSGGKLTNEIRRPPMTQRTKRTSKEKKFPPGIASLPVMAARIPHICRHTMVICKINPTMPCGGSRNMSLIFWHTVGFSGSGFSFRRHGRRACFSAARFEVFVFSSGVEFSAVWPFSGLWTSDSVSLAVIASSVMPLSVFSVFTSCNSTSVKLSSTSEYSIWKNKYKGMSDFSILLLLLWNCHCLLI